MKLPDGQFNVVYLGDQYGGRKNMDVMFKAVEDEACLLTMVGKTNPEATKRAPGNVRFPGPVPVEELYSLLRQADILINCSDEDCDLKTYDYVRAAKPILAYRGRRGCQENIFVHRFNAYIATDVKEGLRELMQDANLRERIAGNLRNYPVLSWRENTKLRIEYFQDVVADYRRRRCEADNKAQKSDTIA